MALASIFANDDEKPVVYFFTAISGLLSVLGFICGLLGLGFGVLAFAGIISGPSDAEAFLILYASLTLIGGSIFVGMLYEMAMSLRQISLK